MYLYVTEEIKLKLLRPEDTDKLFELTNNNRDHLRKWLPWLDTIKAPEDSQDFIRMTMQQFANNQGFQMGIWYKGKLAGVVGHHKISWLNKTTAIGYWLGLEFNGKGIMTKSTRELINFTFNEYKLNSIEIRVAEENLKSRAIPERLGFKFEGILMEREWLYDRFVDHAIYFMTRKDWGKI